MSDLWLEALQQNFSRTLHVSVVTKQQVKAIYSANTLAPMGVLVLR